MSFTTLRKKDWRLLLDNKKVCESALVRFQREAKIQTLGSWTKDFYGKNWESDQSVVTSQLIRLQLCSLAPGHRLLSTFFRAENHTLLTGNDARSCYKGTGWGECRPFNFGTTWHEDIGGCPWFHHWYPLQLLQHIVQDNDEEHFLQIFNNHLLHNNTIERLFFDHHRPYF